MEERDTIDWLGFSRYVQQENEGKGNGKGKGKDEITFAGL